MLRSSQPANGVAPSSTITGAAVGPGGVPQVEMSRHNLTYLLYGAVVFAVLGLLPMVAARCRCKDEARGGKSRQKMRRQAQRLATEEEDLELEDAIMGREDAVGTMDDEDDEEQPEVVRARDKKTKKKDRGRARV